MIGGNNFLQMLYKPIHQNHDTACFLVIILGFCNKLHWLIDWNQAWSQMLTEQVINTGGASWSVSSTCTDLPYHGWWTPHITFQEVTRSLFQLHMGALLSLREAAHHCIGLLQVSLPGAILTWFPIFTKNQNFIFSQRILGAPERSQL